MSTSAVASPGADGGRKPPGPEFLRGTSPGLCARPHFLLLGRARVTPKIGRTLGEGRTLEPRACSLRSASSG
jgi:hypothetical protein